MKTNILCTALILGLTLACLPALAGSPPEIPVQGVITDTRGIALDGHYQIVFSLYDQAQEGALLWSEELSVEVVNGLFSVYLGQTVALDLSLFKTHDGLWLSMKVGSDDEGKRVKLATTPYSGYARFSDAGFLPIGSIQMYDGTGIANAAARTTKIGDDPGDTVDFDLYGEWYVCNGQEATPNLIGKFIRGDDQSGTEGGNDSNAHRHLTGRFNQQNPAYFPDIRFYNSDGSLEQFITHGDGGAMVDEGTWYNDDTWDIQQSGYTYTEYQNRNQNGGTIAGAADNRPAFYGAIFIIRKR